MTNPRSPHPIIVFDGHCRLCIASLRFIEQRDRFKRFRYVPFQGPAGRIVCEHLDIDREALDSFLLLDDGLALGKTAAWSRILSHLTAPWSWLGRLIGVVPAAFSDRVYDFVGRNRLRWVGRNDSCVWPPPADPRSASMVDVREALMDIVRGPRSTSDGRGGAA